MVTLKGFIEVPKEELELVLKELKIHTRLTLNEPGCISFSVIQDQENSCRFSVYEEFESEEAFEEHQARIKKSNWGKVSVNAKRNYEIFIS